MTNACCHDRHMHAEEGVQNIPDRIKPLSAVKPCPEAWNVLSVVVGHGLTCSKQTIQSNNLVANMASLATQGLLP